MNREIFMGKQCLAFEVGSRLVSNPEFMITMYSGMNVDLGFPLGGGRFKIRKERDVVEEVLQAGKGVYLDGKVFYLESALNKHPTYALFQKAYSKSCEKIETGCSSAVDQFLLKHVETVKIPVVKSILSLYDHGLFDKRQFVVKLVSYMSFEEMDELFALKTKQQAQEVA